MSSSKEGDGKHFNDSLFILTPQIYTTLELKHRCYTLSCTKESSATELKAYLCSICFERLRVFFKCGLELENWYYASVSSITWLLHTLPKNVESLLFIDHSSISPMLSAFLFEATMAYYVVRTPKQCAVSLTKQILIVDHTSEENKSWQKMLSWWTTGKYLQKSRKVSVWCIFWCKDNERYFLTQTFWISKNLQTSITTYIAT